MICLWAFSIEHAQDAFESVRDAWENDGGQNEMAGFSGVRAVEIVS